MSETTHRKKFYVTTPIYYVNARPHIGHAYSTIVADVLARRHRLLGDDVFFLTGTDEHGQKIERSAAAGGVPPQEFADTVSKTFSDLWKRMGITNDDFIRTTEERHVRGVQELFTTLYERGHIYLSTYTGQYSIGEEMFVDGPPGTIGPDGRPTETVTEENFFFRLSAFQGPLLELIESDTLRITPESSKNEVLSFVRGGLKDLSVSRSSFTWGIPVPEEVQREAGATQKHVVYVWLDALANYMTAIGYGDPAKGAEFEKWWPADLHLVGKEITRFHCVYWPAFLLAAGLPLPKQVTANGWLLFDNSKMSKSKGNVVRTETILDGFGDHVYGKQFPESSKEERDLFASDVLRYFLLREIPFGQDGSFSFESMVTRYNADLVNGYGNLVSRTLNMVHQYENGNINDEIRAHRPNKSKFPDWWSQDPFATNASFLDDADAKTLKTGQAASGIPLVIRISVKGELVIGVIGNGSVVTGPRGNLFYDDQPIYIGDVLQLAIDPLIRAFGELSSSLDFSRFLQLVSTHVKLADVLLSNTRPWKLQSIDPKRKEIIYAISEYIRIITAVLNPILPDATGKVWQQLGLDPTELINQSRDFRKVQWGGLKSGTKLGPMVQIFPRADKSLVSVLEELEGASQGQLKVKGQIMPTEDTSQLPAIAETHPAAPLKDQSTPTPALEVAEDLTHPAAPPRTSTLETVNPGGDVGASGAITTERVGTPPRQEAAASGIFAGGAETAQIGIEDFAKVDLRVAKIVVAERIPKADKLLRLEVDLGYEQRQILSGIAEWYQPEELVGRKIVIIANLAPRKMRGLESRGMLLAASEGENGKPVLATFGEEIAVGTRLR